MRRKTRKWKIIKHLRPRSGRWFVRGEKKKKDREKIQIDARHVTVTDGLKNRFFSQSVSYCAVCSGNKNTTGASIFFGWLEKPWPHIVSLQDNHECFRIFDSHAGHTAPAISIFNKITIRLVSPRNQLVWSAVCRPGWLLRNNLNQSVFSFPLLLRP